MFTRVFFVFLGRLVADHVLFRQASEQKTALALPAMKGERQRMQRHLIFTRRIHFFSMFGCSRNKSALSTKKMLTPQTALVVSRHELAARPDFSRAGVRNVVVCD